MKKTLLGIYLIIILFICIGCEKPPEYDEKSKGWKLWVSGIVDKTSIKIDGNKRTFVIEFKGDLEFKSKSFYNFEEIKEKIVEEISSLQLTELTEIQCNHDDPKTRCTCCGCTSR